MYAGPAAHLVCLGLLEGENKMGPVPLDVIQGCMVSRNETVGGGDGVLAYPEKAMECRGEGSLEHGTVLLGEVSPPTEFTNHLVQDLWCDGFPGCRWPLVCPGGTPLG